MKYSDMATAVCSMWAQVWGPRTDARVLRKQDGGFEVRINEGTIMFLFSWSLIENNHDKSLEFCVIFYSTFLVVSCVVKSETGHLRNVRVYQCQL